jgi:hypothetical protein
VRFAFYGSGNENRRSPVFLRHIGKPLISLDNVAEALAHLEAKASSDPGRRQHPHLRNQRRIRSASREPRLA